MNPAVVYDLAALPFELARQVDQACDQFEECWEAGGRPRIEDYLAGIAPPASVLLLQQLIELEVAGRRDAGELPRAEDYLARFPGLDPGWLTRALGTAVPSTLHLGAVPEGGEVPVIRGYEILGVLGHGGMGVVYQARQVSLDRVVAVKVLLAGLHATPSELGRFQAEAEAHARLEHPHIARIYEVGQADGHPYLVLEYVAGGSLDKRLAGAPQPAQQAAELVRTLAEAVHYAHQRGLVHRDLKPANVLLTEAGSPKITDFGLAKRLQPAAGTTRTGEVVGTPQYMAPEQASGRPGRVGPPTDVYALGVILYECLTGRPPFRAESTLETLVLVQTQDPVPVRRLQPRVPRDLETICHRCLEKEPARRYASAAELAEDLRRWSAGEPIRARRASALERAVKWARRRPGVAALVAGLVALTVLGSGLVTWQWRQAVAALAREDQARLEAVLEARPDAVANLLPNLSADRPEIRARLEYVWQTESLQRDRRMRAALALLPVDPERMQAPLVEWMLQVDDPSEMLLVRDCLKPAGADLAPQLWAEWDTQRDAGIRLRLLAVLAAFDPHNPRWEEAAEQGVEALLSVNALHLETWARALYPVREQWQVPLEWVFHGTQSGEMRLAATSVLANYLHDDPAALTRLIADADPRQYAILFPVLAAHRKQALGLLRAQLEQTLFSFDQDTPIDPRWKARFAEVGRELEAADGLLAERFAFAASLPLDRFQAVARTLGKAGYRPVRVRPWRGPDRTLTAVVWHRDGRAWAWFADESAEQVRQRLEQMRQRGYVPWDVAGYLTDPGRDPVYASLWVSQPGAQQGLYVGVPGREMPAALERMQQRGRAPASVQAVRLADRSVVYSGVVNQKWEGSGTDMDRHPWEFQTLKPQQWSVVMDATLIEPDERLPLRPEEVAGWLASGASGLLGLGLWGWFQSPESYALSWHTQGLEDVRLAGIDPSAHQTRGRELARQGYRPCTVGAVRLAGVGPRVVSVWLRPLGGGKGPGRWAVQQANLAATLVRLGDPEPAWQMLRHQENPEARSRLLERLGSLRVEVKQVLDRLDTKQDVSVLRALILALGEFGPDQLPPPVRQQLLPRLLDLYENNHDAGVHAAIDWLLRAGQDDEPARPLNWGQDKALARIDKKLADQRDPLVCAVQPVGKAGQSPAATWWVNSQGQTFAVRPGPVEFVMGAPAGQVQDQRHPEHRRRIEQSFALATKPVTVGQFRQFLKDHPRLGDYYKHLPERSSDEPVTGVRLYDAALYCLWLSKEEGIPANQYCYPAREEIEKFAQEADLADDLAARGKTLPPLKMPADYLKRTGYRLPTEAEWEYACRAGAVTTRYYGSDDDLLDRYAWNQRNANNRLWPVGLKRPNDLGLFDMLGNVHQWTSSPLAGSPIEPGQVILDKTPGNYSIQATTPFVIRGSSVNTELRSLRSDARWGAQPRWQDAFGFRVARTCR
jgi:formylglycine-generating enzyme required for sulfatase activity